MASLLDMAQARLQGLLDLPARAGRALVDPTVFSGLLGAPTLPKERGIAQAAYGLPPEPNMSVLNPEQAVYMQGYAQGEPLSYLGLLAPFTAPAAVAGAKAVAPQAGMALENYMARQGLIQPLTAYHGTPHTIQGQFDINKVGTGEGAQSYGHGMYFAENPAVAAEYRKNLSPTYIKKIDGQLYDSSNPEHLASHYVDMFAKRGKSADEIAKILVEEGGTEAHKIAANIIKKGDVRPISTEQGGNLYKVDIPDADIPNMLDWDKPLSQQPKVVQKAFKEIAKQDPDLPLDFLIKGDATGGSLMQAMDKVKASELLTKQGVKGVRYLDAGSRPTNVIDKRLEDLYQKHNGDIEKAADDFMRTIHDSPKKKTEIRARIIQDLQNRPTSNFVVFEPSQVNILEKNSEKVEGLLD
jgi:hypothetical protein